jgi:hypothetical protein
VGRAGGDLPSFLALDSGESGVIMTSDKWKQWGCATQRGEEPGGKDSR